MKYRFICIVTIVTMLIVSFGVSMVDPPKNRYHQHKEALEKSPCTHHGEDIFCTHLPLLNIVSDEEIPEPYMVDANGNILLDDEGTRKILNNEMVGATLEYFDNPERNNHLFDKPVVEARTLIRTRGETSRDFDKKGYLLKITEENMVDGVDVSFSEMTADNTWVLNGPFLDKTLVRNYLCYNMSGEIMDYAPNVRFCELFLNGEYMGIYLLVEKIGYSEYGRINSEKTDPKVDVTPYIVQIDRGAESELTSIIPFGSRSYIYTPPGKKRGQFEIVYPGKTLTEAQRRYIEKDISKFEKALYSFDYKDSHKGYHQYIDVDSFVDYFLIMEFTLNYDVSGFSNYVYKDIGDKLKRCVWDFNSAFDLYTTSVVTPETFLLQGSFWYNYLFKDEEFVDKVVKRYQELRKSYFNEDYLHQYIDETIAYLGPAIERNYEKWGYSFQSEYNGVNYDFLKPIERNPRNYEEAVVQLKECISQRIEHMDKNLDRLYSLSHDSINKKFNNNKEMNLR